MSNNRRKTDRSDGAGVNIWEAALSEDEVPQPAESSDPAEEFSDVDVLSTFKPMKPASNADRDDYEVAMTGPAAFMSPAPKKADVKAESAPAPIAGMTETPIGAEAKPKRNMMPVYGALAASLAVAAFLGAQALPTAKASQTAVEAKLQPAAVTSVASLSIASQPIISEEGSQTVAASTEAQPEPSVVAMAKPIEMTKSPIATTPIAAPKVPEAEFTPLQAQANPKPVETSSLSRADCASRFKTVSRGGSINFKSGSAKLLQSSEPVLHFFASVFEQCSKFKIAVAGHTDSVGNDAFNLALSEQRAASVARYLVDLGIPQESLHAVGYGEAAPIAGNNTALRRSRNRRIEFMIYGG